MSCCTVHIILLLLPWHADGMFIVMTLFVQFMTRFILSKNNHFTSHHYSNKQNLMPRRQHLCRDNLRIIISRRDMDHSMPGISEAVEGCPISRMLKWCVACLDKDFGDLAWEYFVLVTMPCLLILSGRSKTRYTLDK